jgi:hypothetical protein
MWKTYAKQVLFYDFISFNDWFKSPSYRRHVLNGLYIEQRNDDVSFIPKSGGGSSFDKRRLQGEGKSMNVLERWKEMDNEDIKQMIKKDEELINLNRELFREEYPW